MPTTRLGRLTAGHAGTEPPLSRSPSPPERVCLCDGVIDYLRRSCRRAADTAGRRWEERQRTVCKISQRDSDADMLAPRLAAMRGRLKMLEWKMREQASRMESRTDIVQ